MPSGDLHAGRSESRPRLDGGRPDPAEVARPTAHAAQSDEGALPAMTPAGHPLVGHQQRAATRGVAFACHLSVAVPTRPSSRATAGRPADFPVVASSAVTFESELTLALWTSEAARSMVLGMRGHTEASVRVAGRARILATRCSELGVALRSGFAADHARWMGEVAGMPEDTGALGWFFLQRMGPTSTSTARPSSRRGTGPASWTSVPRTPRTSPRN